MQKYLIDLEDIKSRYANNKIKWVKDSGVYLDVIEERHARLVLPLGDLHLNHVGVAYAGSIFMLGEVSTAAILYSAYGTEKYIPIASKAEIEFIKPAKTDLVVDYTMSGEEAAILIEPIEERGRGKVTLTYDVTDTEGSTIAKMTSVVYLLPAGQQIK